MTRSMLLLLFSFPFFLLGTHGAFADPLSPVATATLINPKSASETIQVMRSNKVLNLSSPADLQEEDQLTTLASQTVLLRLQEGSLVTLAPMTTIEVFKVAPTATEAGANASTTLRIVAGVADFVAAKIYKGNTRFRVRSNDATMGVRGTEFVAEQDSKAVNLHTISGEVEFFSVAKPNEVRIVGEGKASIFETGSGKPIAPAKYDKEAFNAYLKERSSVFSEQIIKNRRMSSAGSSEVTRKKSKKRRFK